MLKTRKISPAIGAEVLNGDLSGGLTGALADAIHDALMQHLVLFFRGADITPRAHLDLARAFGDIDAPHPLYASVEGFPNIVRLENGAGNPPDTDAWHTDLTFKAEQPFASILVARALPDCGGDTLWSSCYAAYDRLGDGIKRDLAGLSAVHDMGDFRNSVGQDRDDASGSERLNAGMGRFGHQIRPLIGTHPVTGRKYLNFNESFVSHIMGMTTNRGNLLKSFLADHMNRPEDQLRWRWRVGDVAIWDNRVTMHYAVSDYLPQRRCMHRVTVLRDRRTPPPRDPS